MKYPSGKISSKDPRPGPTSSVSASSYNSSSRKRFLLAGYLLLLLMAGLVAARDEVRPGRPDRLAWFREARFGLFIHRGVYSRIGREEWARELLQIPWAEYQRYARNFKPVNYNPREWVRLAKEAGVKYIVITSKHHDGFCLYDSAFTENDSGGKSRERPAGEAG